MGVIPYVWDYTCDKDVDGCKGKFRSFDDKESPEITSDIIARLDNNNYLNNPISIRG